MIVADAARAAAALLNGPALPDGPAPITVLSAMWPDQPDELLCALIAEARNRRLPLHLLIADLSGRLAFLNDDALRDLVDGSLRITTIAGSVPRRLAPLIEYRIETIWELNPLLESGDLSFDIVVTRATCLATPHSQTRLDSRGSLSGPVFRFNGMVGYGPAAIPRASALGLEIVPGLEHVQAPIIDTDIPAFAYASSAPTPSDSGSTAPTLTPTPEQRRIGERVAALIPAHATLQLGLGAIPDAVIAALDPAGSFGLHCGMLPPSALSAISAGVFTGAHKGRDVGLHVATGMSPLGTHVPGTPIPRPVVHLRPLNATHNPAVLASLHRLWAINSAFEVDLAGNVNAEWIGGVRSTSGGGQADFARAAHLHPDGASVIALPARARDGSPRIVRALDHAPTTPGQDVNIIVTEFGVADLRECSATQRAARLALIAHPDDRHLLT